MPDGHLVQEETLTLPYAVLRTLHNGGSEVRVYTNLLTQTRQVGKRVSLLGREDTVAVHEATLLREIDHPNIAKVFDVATVGGKDPVLRVVEIVMPYYQQGSVLDAMVKQGLRFRVGHARDLAVRALRGLDHLHEERRILHRDVKPANLFLASEASAVKIGDFGEAIRMDEEGSAEPLLSPQFWTPPETFCGSRYTVSSELYSMGMSLHEMLSGPFPYDEYLVDHIARRLGQRRHAVAPRHLRFQPHVPEELRRVVRRATHRDPSRRYQAAHEMLTDLLHARFVDWDWPELSRETSQWTGIWRGQALRVVARPVRGKGWRARCERLYDGGWRKLPGSPEPSGSDAVAAAATAFDHVDRHVARA